MNATTWAAFSAVVVSVVAAILTYRSSSRANATNDRKVDLEEHRDAIARLEKIIEKQDKHIERISNQAERVQDQAERVQQQLAKEQDVSMTLRAQVRILSEQIDELNRSRSRLEQALASGRVTAGPATSDN